MSSNKLNYLAPINNSTGYGITSTNILKALDHKDLSGNNITLFQDWYYKSNKNKLKHKNCNNITKKLVKLITKKPTNLHCYIKKQYKQFKTFKK